MLGCHLEFLKQRKVWERREFLQSGRVVEEGGGGEEIIRNNNNSPTPPHSHSP